MQLPKRLSARLAKDKVLERKVQATIEEFEPWIVAGGQRPTFFPDYTDHSLRHIEEVLETSADLIRTDAWNAMSSADVAVFIVAVLLHDSALHLSKEGFEALVAPTSVWKPLLGFADKPWHQLWAEYSLEAQRFDEQTLLRVFGDALPAPKVNLDQLVLDERAKRLIGEFLRRHHPRLAHEIARFGVPGPSGTTPLSVHLTGDHADLAGLVARSHGASLRDMLPYLKSVYHNRVAPLGIHVVFLMVLLRVSDYLQIQASRAPARLHAVHRVRSPYSRTEWNVHAAVRDVRESEDDPETIFVHAIPADVHTYLRLKQWLSSLQQELDHSWAVLGEVFSRQHPKLQKIGIKLRRIGSNIDNVAALSESVAYVPKQVSFTTSGPDLLKLLIGPLYGHRPEIGVRELVQNAVDSVRELQSLRERALVFTDLDLTLSELRGDVDVTVEQVNDDTILTVADRGTGMTPELVTEYFLRAGASFRSSGPWRKAFLDDADHSLVLRAGRFGIGALAAFLIGDRIEVSTRHYSVPADRGIRFQADLQTDPIELCWCERSVGTTISVVVSSEAKEKLFSKGHYPRPAPDRWDWYCLDDPKLVRRIAPDGPILRQRYHIPAPGEPAWGDWRQIAVLPFSDVYWTYDDVPALTCNGIIVHEDVSPFGDKSTHSRSYFKRNQDVLLPDRSPHAFRAPAVSIYDPDGFLPLDLRRETLTYLPENLATMLLQDVCRDYLAHAIATVPRYPFFETGDCSWCMGTTYPGSCAPRERIRAFWYWTPQGYVVNEARALWELNVKRIVFYPILVEGSRLVRAGRAELWARGESVVVVPVPLILDAYAEGPDDDEDETVFGSIVYARAYGSFLQRNTADLIRSLLRSDNSESDASELLLQSYRVQGLTVYSSDDTRSELEEYFDVDERDGKVPHITRYELANRYVITMGNVDYEDSGPSFTLLPRTRPFPIIEVSVCRTHEAPEPTEFYSEWTKCSLDAVLPEHLGESSMLIKKYPRLSNYIHAQHSTKIYRGKQRSLSVDEF